MRRRLFHCLQVAFLLLPSSMVLQAQRGGGAAHAGGTVHAGSSFSSPGRTFAPPSRSSFSSPATRSPSFQSRLPRPWPGGSTGYRNNGGVGYRRNYPFVYAGYPWLFPFGYGFSNGDEPGDAGVYQPPPLQAEPPPSDYEQMAENAPMAFRPEYQGQAAPAPEPVRDQPSTTLIFKDGRSPAQVHNYALTATTLYALDGDLRKEIPLSVLDVPATVEANRAAGVDFALPMSH
jgi:hypothetical protein